MLVVIAESGSGKTVLAHAIMRLLRGLTEDRAHQELSSVLRELDLDFERIAQRYPHQLSGGPRAAIRVEDQARRGWREATAIAQPTTRRLARSITEAIRRATPPQVRT